MAVLNSSLNRLKDFALAFSATKWSYLVTASITEPAPVPFRPSRASLLAPNTYLTACQCTAAGGKSFTGHPDFTFILIFEIQTNIHTNKITGVMILSGDPLVL